MLKSNADEYKGIDQIQEKQKQNIHSMKFYLTTTATAQKHGMYNLYTVFCIYISIKTKKISF